MDNAGRGSSVFDHPSSETCSSSPAPRYLRVCHLQAAGREEQFQHAEVQLFSITPCTSTNLEQGGAPYAVKHGISSGGVRVRSPCAVPTVAPSVSAPVGRGWKNKDQDKLNLRQKGEMRRTKRCILGRCDKLSEPAPLQFTEVFATPVLPRL